MAGRGGVTPPLPGVRREGVGRPAPTGTNAHGSYQNHLSGMSIPCCGRPSRVPAGKTVKCPECGNRFTVSDEEPRGAAEEAEESSTDTTPAGERKPKPTANKTTPKQGAGKKPAAPDNAPFAVKKDDDDDEGGGTLRL